MLNQDPNFFLFQDKDQYGNEVQKLARPLPVEYLLVDIPASTPLTQLYTFPARAHHFPVENRLVDGHLQDLATLNSYLNKYTPSEFLEVRISFFLLGSRRILILFYFQAISDFHVLFYLFTMDCFGIKMKTQMGKLLEAVRNQNKELAIEWKNSDTWSTLEHLLEANSTPAG